MTSRQCLFHPITGCEKHKVDATCIQQCEKTASITNLKMENFFIEKTKGNYHAIYNERNFLNTDIVTDLPDHFSSFFIDLKDVKTDTKMMADKKSIISLFEELIAGHANSQTQLHQKIQPTIQTPYIKGI